MRYIGMLGRRGRHKAAETLPVSCWRGLWKGLQELFLELPQGGDITGKVIEVAVRALSASENVAVVLGIKELLIILGCSALIILASCTIPSSRRQTQR